MISDEGSCSAAGNIEIMEFEEISTDLSEPIHATMVADHNTPSGLLTI